MYLDMRNIGKCMICNGDKFTPYKNGVYGKYIYTCTECKLVFTNPQPEQNDLLKRYGNDYYTHWTSPKQQERRIKLWKRRFKIVKKLLPSVRLLDVGCGEGLFLYTAKQNGYDVYGIEVSEFAVKYAKEKFGLNINNTALENSDFPDNSFDIITFWHTVEHLSSPEITLKKAEQLLKPGGYLIIAVPNVDDVIGQEFYRFVNRQYFQIYTPDSKEPHLYHFSVDTLKLLLQKCNFKIIKIKTDFCQVDPYWRIIEYVSYYVSKMLRKKWYLAILAIAQKYEDKNFVS